MTNVKTTVAEQCIKNWCTEAIHCLTLVIIKESLQQSKDEKLKPLFLQLIRGTSVFLLLKGNKRDFGGLNASRYLRNNKTTNWQL